jgi:hypothetical protein
MNKQTVALIALFAGWILLADIADATTYEDIAGQWCGDVTDYVFAPNTLTVKFHDDRPANVFKITKYTYTNDTVRMIGSTLTAKSRSRFSLNSAARRWRSRRTTTNRADLSIAAETASYLGYLLFAQTCRSFSATSPRRHGRMMKLLELVRRDRAGEPRKSI